MVVFGLTKDEIKSAEGRNFMINDEILAIKNSILHTVGNDCEKIILFGSYAYGTPREKSDYDVFVVLKDHSDRKSVV